MRLSDLLSREPVGEILRHTLGAYWSELCGSSVDVFWGNEAQGQQEWRGNAYLNFFCTRGANSVCFENIVREFSYTQPWWRHGLQATYVRAAVMPPIREFLSQLRFCVSTPIPHANEQLVIGGRNRLRIIHPSLGESVVIAKYGFQRIGLERELAAREGYAKAVAPKLLGMRAKGMAFAEEYYVGTPANRLASRFAMQARADACNRLIEAVHLPSLRVVGMADYLCQLAVAIQGFSFAAGEQAKQLSTLAARLCGSASLGLALTHGDFQNGNILVTEHDLRIIDWETATERSQLYDLATLSAGIRLAPDRLYSWRTEVTQWLKAPARIPELLVPIDGLGSLLGHAAVWWLEEAIFQLEEARAGFQSVTTASDWAVATGLSQARLFLENVSR